MNSFLFFSFRSLSKAFAKLRSFSYSLQIFSEFFSKNFFEAFPAEPFSLSYRSGKIRYLVSTRQPQHSVNLLAVSLESGCKITGFFRIRKYYTHFFYNFFQSFSQIAVLQQVLRDSFLKGQLKQNAIYTLLYNIGTNSQRNTNGNFIHKFVILYSKHRKKRFET